MPLEKSYGRVLIVDDDAVSLAVAALLLEAEGFEVRQAASGESACQPGSDSWTPDVLLADLCMPGLHGAELARTARQRWPQVRVIAMSAAQPRNIEGYERVLQKPLPTQGLRAAIEGNGEAEAEEQPDAGELDLRIFAKLERAMPSSALRQLYQAFVQDAHERLQTIASALEMGDVATVRREAHTLRGAAGMTGSVSIHRISAQLESGINSLDDLRACFLQLTQAFHRLSIILARKLP